MDEQRAREILGDRIESDGRLVAGLSPKNSGSEYMGWTPDDEIAALDGRFTADELEAIAWWMRNAGRLGYK